MHGESNGPSPHNATLLSRNNAASSWDDSPSSLSWLVVEPTHLKNIRQNLESSPNRGENKKILETTTIIIP